MTFATDLDWALTGYELKVDAKHPGITFGLPPGTNFEGVLQPRRWPSGHVFTEDVESRFVYNQNLKRKDPVKSFRVRSVEFVDVPDSQFKPSAFGLPDAVLQHAQPRTFGVSIIYILAGMLFLVLSILLKRLSTLRAS